jgi:hypothetical protein
MKFKETVAAFADYVQYSPTLWYRGFYNSVYSRAISTLISHECDSTSLCTKSLTESTKHLR